MSELAAIDSRIKLTVYDIKENAKEAKFLGVDKAPATVIGGKKIYNAYYFGMPSGYEFSALLEDIVDASAGTRKRGDKGLCDSDVPILPQGGKDGASACDGERQNQGHNGRVDGVSRVGEPV